MHVNVSLVICKCLCLVVVVTDMTMTNSCLCQLTCVIHLNVRHRCLCHWAVHPATPQSTHCHLAMSNAPRHLPPQPQRGPLHPHSAGLPGLGDPTLAAWADPAVEPAKARLNN